MHLASAPPVQVNVKGSPFGLRANGNPSRLPAWSGRHRGSQREDSRSYTDSVCSIDFTGRIIRINLDRVDPDASLAPGFDNVHDRPNEVRTAQDAAVRKPQPKLGADDRQPRALVTRISWYTWRCCEEGKRG